MFQLDELPGNDDLGFGSFSDTFDNNTARDQASPSSFVDSVNNEAENSNVLANRSVPDHLSDFHKDTNNWNLFSKDSRICNVWANRRVPDHLSVFRKDTNNCNPFSKNYYEHKKDDMDCVQQNQHVTKKSFSEPDKEEHILLAWAEEERERAKRIRDMALAKAQRDYEEALDSISKQLELKRTKLLLLSSSSGIHSEEAEDLDPEMCTLCCDSYVELGVYVCVCMCTCLYIGSWSENLYNLYI